MYYPTIPLRDHGTKAKYRLHRIPAKEPVPESWEDLTNNQRQRIYCMCIYIDSDLDTIIVLMFSDIRHENEILWSFLGSLKNIFESVR